MGKRTFRLFRLLLLPCLLAHYGWGQAAPGSRVVVFGQRMDAPFFKAVQASGWTVLPPQEQAQADVFCVSTPLRMKPEDRQALVEAVTQGLKAGKGFILCAGNNGDADEWPYFDALLPLNPWSAAQHNGRRGNGLAIPVRGSKLAEALQGQKLPISWCFDLHLPFATIESGEHRYQWQKFGKELLNTDWQVHWRSDQAGLLPVLISGRYGPGTAFCFSGNLADPDLARSPKYPEFIKALLEAARPRPLPAATRPGGLSLTIPSHGVAKPTVVVRNAGNTPARVLLAYKIRNAERSLLNSATQPIEVAPGASLAVELQERYDGLGNEALIPSADRLPFRHVEAGLATLGRTELLATASGMVDLHPAVTLEFRGDDVRTLEDLKSWPDRDYPGYIVGEGAPIYSYVYATGTTPKLRIVLRNGLHNIAPLAVPKDLEEPESLRTQGLNDLAYSRGDIRGSLPLWGAWAAGSDRVGRISLAWPEPVLAAGQRLAGRWNFTPRDQEGQIRYLLTGQKGAEEAKLAERQGANSKAELGEEDRFAPAAITGCRLDFQGSPAPGPGQSRASVVEWEVLGWPDAKPPPAATGELTVNAVNLLTRKSQTILKETVTLDGQQELARELALPSKSKFGPVRIDAVFTPAGGKPVAVANFDLLFIPPGREALKPVKGLDEAKVSPLCSPGFYLFEGFGLGTQADTTGWGGPDDQAWALAHNFMETGSGAMDSARRMFTTANSFNHYTFAWRDFPSGRYYGDYACDRIFESGRVKDKKHFRYFLSDRWTCSSPSAMFTWPDYLRFDEYLRAKGDPGLSARSRKAIADEICSRHADQWQHWAMNRYADKMLETQKRMADAGVDFCVTTHGSFPLAGGELGQKLAKTHKAVGTDLFWELMCEDLYFSLGRRFGLVAANPDLESGAYNEWGWVSAALNNPHWYAETGAAEPSRRQWYSTYFAGRIDSSGIHHPYHNYGYDAQGGFGVKNTVNDWQRYYRTMQLVSRLRPEQAAGFGMVVSWRWQERRMGKEAGGMWFGLYPSKGKPSVDQQFGDVWHRLVKAGVPISFVTSTFCLKQWKGTNPLIVIDAYNLEPWELQELRRLNLAGTPVICVGLGEGNGPPEARELFGDIAEGGTTLLRRQGRGTTVLCAVEPGNLNASTTEELARKVLEAAGKPLQVPPGIAAFPLVNNDRLMLALNDQGDRGRMATISVRPALLKADCTGRKFRVIDLDRAVELESIWDNDTLSFILPMAASDGRLVMIEKEP